MRWSDSGSEPSRRHCTRYAADVARTVAGVLVLAEHVVDSYATGTAPIIFGSGYTTLNEWRVAGAIMSAVNLLLLVLVGSIWWTMLGYIANGLSKKPGGSATCARHEMWPKQCCLRTPLCRPW